MDEAFLKKLFSTVKCGVCGQKYNVSDVKIVNHEDNLWFLSASCKSCNTNGLIVAVIDDGKISELISELTTDELEKFAHYEVVDVNDVVDMHNFLKEFNGDFVRLFSEA